MRTTGRVKDVYPVLDVESMHNNKKTITSSDSVTVWEYGNAWHAAMKGHGPDTRKWWSMIFDFFSFQSILLKYYAFNAAFKSERDSYN